MTVKPSMRDGLHWKLLGNGFCAVAVFGPQPLGFPRNDPVPLFKSVVPAGKADTSFPSVQGFAPGRTRTPFASTVIPAPSYAPSRLGSCSCSARFPLCVVSHPSTASSGSRSICGLLLVALKPVWADQLLAQPALHPSGTPFGANPNKHTTRSLQASRA